MKSQIRQLQTIASLIGSHTDADQLLQAKRQGSKPDCAPGSLPAQDRTRRGGRLESGFGRLLFVTSIESDLAAAR